MINLSHWFAHMLMMMMVPPSLYTFTTAVKDQLLYPQLRLTQFYYFHYDLYNF